jgi:hypothetical protein
MRRFTAASFTLLAIGLAAFPHGATAQSPAAPGTIADNDSIFIDGTTFRVTAGKAKGSVSGVIKTLGARELGPGAIVFRSGERLYIVDAPFRLPDSSSAGRSVLLNADKRQTNRIRIEYIAPKNPEHQSLHDMLKARAALETVQKLFSPFRLPMDVTIKTVGCDMVNAWYEIQDGRAAVTICYEYLQVIMQHAPKETTPEGVTRADALVGQILFLVAHEMGHAVFELFDLPVFGREEDAADQLAAYFLLQLGKERVRGLIGGAAYMYAGYVKDYKENPKVAVPLEAFSSNHGSPEERFYNLLCVAYGADRELFADLVEKGYLPKTRAGSCPYEYKTLAKAVRSQIGPHVDRQMATEIWQSNWMPEAISSALAN